VWLVFSLVLHLAELRFTNGLLGFWHTQPGELLVSNEIIGHLELVEAFSQDAHVIKRETKIKVRLCTVKNKNMRS